MCVNFQWSWSHFQAPVLDGYVVRYWSMELWREIDGNAHLSSEQNDPPHKNKSIRMNLHWHYTSRPERALLRPPELLESWKNNPSYKKIAPIDPWIPGYLVASSNNMMPVSTTCAGTPKKKKNAQIDPNNNRREFVTTPELLHKQTRKREITKIQFVSQPLRCCANKQINQERKRVEQKRTENKRTKKEKTTKKKTNCKNEPPWREY